MKIIMTGGHHSSALPVIHKLSEEYSQTEIFWIGHRHSVRGDRNDTLEYKEIRALGLPFYELIAGKVYRTFNPIRWLRVPVGFVQALYILIKVKPDIILSFGGYLAVPVVIAGWLLGIPSITHEQTVVAGYANKLISKFVKKVLISWPQSEKYFPKDKIVYAGLPVREAIYKITSGIFKTENDLPTIFITTGKTGSHFINELIENILPELLSFCNVIHQCGDVSIYKDYDRLSSFYNEIKNISVGEYFPCKFVLENEIGHAYSEASLVISRSGAHTVTELIALKKPCLLIPIPWVSHNEQYENAKILEKVGLGKIINQDGLTSEAFVSSVKEALTNINTFRLKDESILKLVKVDAASIICDETLRLAQKI